MSGSRHSDAWDSPGFLLWHATLRWQRAMAEALSRADGGRARLTIMVADAELREGLRADGRSVRTRPGANGVDGPRTRL